MTENISMIDKITVYVTVAALLLIGVVLARIAGVF